MKEGRAQLSDDDAPGRSSSSVAGGGGGAAAAAAVSPDSRSARLRIHFPDGTFISQSFDADVPLDVVVAYVATSPEFTNGGYLPEFSLRQRGEVSDLAYGASLKDLGLSPRAQLQVIASKPEPPKQGVCESVTSWLRAIFGGGGGSRGGGGGAAAATATPSSSSGGSLSSSSSGGGGNLRRRNFGGGSGGGGGGNVHGFRNPDDDKDDDDKEKRAFNGDSTEYFG